MNGLNSEFIFFPYEDAISWVSYPIQSKKQIDILYSFGIEFYAQFKLLGRTRL